MGVDDGELTEALGTDFFGVRHKLSAEQWDTFTRSQRRAMLVWLVEAKKPATRAGRLTKIAERAAVGERAHPPQ